MILSKALECIFQFKVESDETNDTAMNKPCKVYNAKTTHGQYESISLGHSRVHLSRKLAMTTMIRVDSGPRKPISLHSPCHSSFPQCQ